MRARLLMAAAIFSLVLGTGFAQKDNPGSGTFIGGPKYKKDKTPTSRSLKGIVDDDSGKPLQGALVTLTNKGTNERLTFITKKDGRYNFDGLSFTTDYEVSARYKDYSSETKKLSQYDRTPNIVRILEVGPPKESDQKGTPQAAAK